MSPVPLPPESPPRSGTLAFLTALFILSFFIFFSYRGLSSYFTFDDGTTVIFCLRPFETPVWRDLLHILTVFTTAFRPLTTLFWRPLYAVFGFNPLPYRIVVHLLLTVNIGLAYVLARRLQLSRAGAALTALIFCYNASTIDLYYDTCLVADVMCFLFYGLAVLTYVRGREAGEPIGVGRAAAVGAFYLLALDSKEMAVTLPGVLVIYELLFRRGDLRDRRKLPRVGGLLAGMFVVGAIYLQVKVADMSQNAAYHPHVTAAFMVNNIGHYLEQLLYLRENSVTPLTSGLILLGVSGAGALVRSRAANFGVLFFVTTLIPVAVIASRSGYAAYLPYFGLALAAGAILDGGRSRAGALFVRKESGRKELETATAVAAFLCVAVLLGWAHMVRRLPLTEYYEWTTPPVVGFMKDLRENIPEFPPNARVLISEDPWTPDWGQMFLVQLMYHDKTIWVDRTKNMNQPPDLASYDLVVAFQPPDMELAPARLFKMPMKWEVRGRPKSTDMFSASSPNAHGATMRVDFTPQSVKGGQNTMVSIPGVSNVAVNVLYRVVSRTKTTSYLVKNWCTLDAKGSCTVTAPPVTGSMAVDWIQPVNQRWIFLSGVLTIEE